MTARNKAFTLLELSVVMIIISVIMGGAMVIFNRSLDQRQLEETQMKMAAIQKALLDYRRAFDRIPCPADITQNMDATSNNYFGVEAANQSSCIGGTPAANFSLTPLIFTGNSTNASAVITNVGSTSGLSVGTVVSGTGIVAGSSIASIDSATQLTIDTPAIATNVGIAFAYNTVAGGMVPTKALKLPDDYAIDGWGRRIMYMVDVNMTVNGGFKKTPITDASTSRISVSTLTFTGTVSTGSAIVTGISSTALLKVGDSISHASIPSGTAILSINSGSQITLNANATASGSFALGLAKTNGAVYSLLSSGKNGHGAYPQVGGSTRFSNYTSNDPDELTNCHCTSTATAASFERNFIQKPLSLGTFDDIVVYATRADMRSGAE